MFSKLWSFWGWVSNTAVTSQSSLAPDSRSPSLHARSGSDSEDYDELREDTLDPEASLRKPLHLILHPDADAGLIDLDESWKAISACLYILMTEASGLSDRLHADLSLAIQYLCAAGERTTPGDPPAKELYWRLDRYVRAYVGRTRFYLTERRHCEEALLKFYVKKWKLFLASAKKIALLFTCVHEEHFRLDKGTPDRNRVGVYPYLIGLWKEEMFEPAAKSIVLRTLEEILWTESELTRFYEDAELDQTLDQVNRALTQLGVETPLRSEIEERRRVREAIVKAMSETWNHSPPSPSEQPGQSTHLRSPFLDGT